MGTTPTFSQTNPPAKFEIAAISLGFKPEAKHKLATLITVSPAPDTSEMSRICAAIWSDFFPLLIKIPFSDKVKSNKPILCSC